MTHQEPAAPHAAGSHAAGSHADPPLVPVEQHLADVLAAIRPVDPVWVPLAGANGTVLAEHVTASTPLPSFDNSAMDGYAVRAADLAGASAGTRRSRWRSAGRSPRAIPATTGSRPGPACRS